METELQVAEVVTRLPSRRCSVCNDEYDGGLHYGAHACVCCKAFFRRTVRQGVEYDCSSDGDCAIEGELRVTCRACRFEKCLAAGLQREAVRPVRGPIKRIKKRGRKWPAWCEVKPESDGNSIGSPTASDSSCSNSDEIHADHTEFLIEPSHQFSTTAFIQDVAADCAEFCDSLSITYFNSHEMELLLNDICGPDTVNEDVRCIALSRNSSVSLAMEDLQFSEDFDRQMMEWLAFRDAKSVS